MTCIVGIVSEDGVTIGGDSAGVGGYYNVSVRKDSKVFTKGKFLFGFCGSFRLGQLLRYSFEAPDHDPRTDVDTYLRTTWLSALRKCLKDGGFARNEQGEEQAPHSSFLVGYAGRLFEVEQDFQVGENVSPFNAVGCGEQFAKGALSVLKDLSFIPDDKKVLFALEAAAEHSGGVRGPFNVQTLANEKAPANRLAGALEV